MAHADGLVTATGRTADATPAKQPARRTHFVTTAETLARRMHRGQRDRAGNPYSGHLARIAAAADAYGAHAKAAAWLHDAIEDTDLEERQIAERIGGGVARTVATLTREEGERYTAYIERIARSGDLHALVIKLEDIADHAMTTTEALTPSLARRYLDAYDRLSAVAGDRWRSSQKRVVKEVLSRIAQAHQDRPGTGPPNRSRPPTTKSRPETAGLSPTGQVESTGERGGRPSPRSTQGTASAANSGRKTATKRSTTKMMTATTATMPPKTSR